MVRIFIDDKPYEVDEKNNLLHCVLSLGFDLPYFCWHPAMGSVGACRQCAVIKYKDENDKKGKIVMACMEPVTDGLRISVKNPEAKEFRASVIEWLMTNHPHDCPVCDEGGECHLQDMTVMSGHNYRRFRFNKRTHRNQNLGPFINHEMNRCIQCYRCVRFYREYAGGRDFDVFASKNRVYFGRHQEGTLESEFSGNLVEICPTGVFTDKTLKQHYTRKWDLTNSPSICHLCSLGCNILVSERYGSMRRVLSRFNGEVNGYFLCDRGRFGYEFVNSKKRIRQPLRRGSASGQLEPVDRQTILNTLRKTLASQKGIIGIGSPTASLESNFLLKKLVGTDNFYPGVTELNANLVSRVLSIMQTGPAKSASLKDVENCDAVLILGEDVTNTAPMLALAIRQAARRQPANMAEKLHIPEWQDHAVREATQDQKGPLFVATPTTTKLDEIATSTYRGTADDIARFGFAIASDINASAPKVENMSADTKKLAETIASQLKGAERPLVVSGTGSQSVAVLESAANIVRALSEEKKDVKICFALPEANSLGLTMMSNRDLDKAFKAAEDQTPETVVILENNLYRRNDKKTVSKFLNTFKNIIVLDSLENELTANATMVIPAGTFAESDGTIVNNEGRAQRFYKAFASENAVQESWRWLLSFAVTSEDGKNEEYVTIDNLAEAIIKEMAQFSGIDKIAPNAGFRIAGQKIPRAPHRFSGRTAMNADRNVSEPKPPEDPDTPLSFTMEGYSGKPPSALIPYFWSPGWNSVQSINKFQIEVGGGLHGGNPGVRIIVPATGQIFNYYADIPGPFKPKKDEWLLVPIYHIYGSEPFSMHTAGVAERAPLPYLALNRHDAKSLDLMENSEALFEAGDYQIKLPVKIIEELPVGSAGVPAGIVPIGHLGSSIWGKITGSGGKS